MVPKAERVKTLFLSPLQPQNAGGGGWGGGGGGVGGGIPASFPSRSPPPKQPFPGGPGPKPWGPGLDPPQGLSGDLANKPEPCIRQPSRVKNSKNAPVLIGS